MSDYDLQRMIERAAPGSQVSIPAGEHHGQWTIGKPLRLVGSGPATVLWSESGPVLTLKAGETRLENLAIETTEEQNAAAILCENGAAAAGLTGRFQNVRVLGRVMGVAGWESWQIPAVIDAGCVSPRQTVQRIYGLGLPAGVQARSGMAGLTIAIRPHTLGGQALHVEIDGQMLEPGLLIDGLVEVEYEGLSALLRITGEVADRAPTTVAGMRQAGKAGFDPDTLRRLTDPGAPPTPAGDPGRARPSSRPAATPNPAPAAPNLVDINALLAQAKAAEDQGDIETAEMCYRRAVTLRPGEVLPLVQLGEFLQRGKNLGAAAAIWEAVQALDAQYPGIAVRLAQLYTQVDRHSQAIQLLEKAVAVERNNPDIYLLLAPAYYRAGRVGEAIWALEQAQTIKPSPKTAQTIKFWKRQLNEQP